MALTAYGVNSPVAVKLWSNKLAYEAIKATWFSKFIGTDSNSLLQIRDETSKGPGDRVRVTLRTQLIGDGVVGDGTLEGNEEALSVYTDDLLIDQLRHAVRSAGKMSEQRIPFSVREEAYNGLRDWWADRLDYWFFNQLCGNTVVTDIRYTGLQAPIAPDTNHRVWQRAASGVTVVTDDANLDSTSLFNLNLIDKCVERAKTLDARTMATPGIVPIRPIRLNGEDKYVLFLHPYQVYDLRTSTVTGQWLDIQKAAITGGEISGNPIYQGSLGEYNGVILHEAFRLANGISNAGVQVANTKRAVFAGAQALFMAFGQDNSPNKMTWVEELFDYENELGVSGGMIAGMKKTELGGFDFGTITVSTYAAAHN